MARIIGDLGAEKALIRELNGFGVHSLRNLEDVESHIKNSDSELQTIKRAQRQKLHDEIQALKTKHFGLVADRSSQQAERARQLTNERNYLKDRVENLSLPTSSFFKRIFRTILFWIARRRLVNLEKNFDNEVDKPFFGLTKIITDLEGEIEKAHTTFEDEVIRRLEPHIAKKNRIDGALEKVGKWIVGARGWPSRAVDILKKYPWPGNVRELASVVEKHLIQVEGPLVRPEDLDLSLYADQSVLSPGSMKLVEWEEQKCKAKISYIMETIEAAGSKVEAARRLGVSPTHLQYLLNQSKAAKVGQGTGLPSS